MKLQSIILNDGSAFIVEAMHKSKRLIHTRTNSGGYFFFYSVRNNHPPETYIAFVHKQATENVNNVDVHIHLIRKRDHHEKRQYQEAQSHLL
jgi:hypothetical protein